MNNEEKKEGIEAAREKAEALKKETELEQIKKDEAYTEAKNALAVVRENSALSAMYADKAKEELNDSLGSQPILKLHTTGRSNNLFIDGTQPDDGSFFYVPTQEAFKTPLIHVLVMSDGYYAEGLPDDRGNPKIGYNNLLGGAIITENGMRPFIMYITSQSIRQSFWDFRNEVNKYARLMRVPKLALTVRMTSEKVPNPNQKWVKANPIVNNIKFTIEKLEDGTPALVTDEKDFMSLVDVQEMLKEMIASIISAKEVEKPASEKRETISSIKGDIVEGEVDEASAEDLGDEIPF